MAQDLSVAAELITNSTRLVADLNADSLDVIELVLEVEREFNIDVTGSDLDLLRDDATVADWVRVVEAKVGVPGGNSP